MHACLGKSFLQLGHHHHRHHHRHHHHQGARPQRCSLTWGYMEELTVKIPPSSLMGLLLRITVEVKAFKSAVLSKKLIDAVRLGPQTQIFGPRPILPLRFTQTRWQRNARAPITTCHIFTRTDKFWTRVLGHENETSSVGSTWLSPRRWLSFIHAKSELPETGEKAILSWPHLRTAVPRHA